MVLGPQLGAPAVLTLTPSLGLEGHLMARGNLQGASVVLSVARSLQLLLGKKLALVLKPLKEAPVLTPLTWEPITLAATQTPSL